MAAIGALVVLARGWLAELKAKATTYFEQRTNAEQRKLLALLGKEAFSFAETVYRELKGAQKMEAAIGYLEERAKTLGVNVTADEVRAAIEAAWMEKEKK